MWGGLTVGMCVCGGLTGGMCVGGYFHRIIGED